MKIDKETRRAIIAICNKYERITMIRLVNELLPAGHKVKHPWDVVRLLGADPEKAKQIYEAKIGAGAIDAVKGYLYSSAKLRWNKDTIRKMIGIQRLPSGLAPKEIESLKVVQAMATENELVEATEDGQWESVWELELLHDHRQSRKHVEPVNFENKNTQQIKIGLTLELLQILGLGSSYIEVPTILDDAINLLPVHIQAAWKLELNRPQKQLNYTLITNFIQSAKSA